MTVYFLPPRLSFGKEPRRRFLFREDGIMTRKIVSAILAAALLFLPLPGCGQEKTPEEEKEGTGMAARTSKEFRLSAFTYPEGVLYPLPEDDGGAALS